MSFDDFDELYDGPEPSIDPGEDPNANNDPPGGDPAGNDPTPDPDPDGIQPDPDPTPNPNPNPDPDPDPDAPTLTGMEMYLSQFGVEGGMINFEDGSAQHFNELNPDKQSEILTQLHGQVAQSVEQKHGLDENEIGVINYLRENKKSFEDIVNEEAHRRAQELFAIEKNGIVNYDEMDPDAVYTLFLRESDPDATTEQIRKDLEAAKGMSNYDKVVVNIKSKLKNTQEGKIREQQFKDQQESLDALEEERKLVATTMFNLEEIDGIGLDDSMKNSVLDTVLNVDNQGNSVFHKEVFSDPQKLLKAAFWYHNGPDILKSKEDYWKKEKSLAYKRGQSSSGSGTPGKQSFSAQSTNKSGTTPQQGSDEYLGIDSLYDE